jgi:spore maturation protein A
MMNWIWFALMAIALVMAAVSGTAEDVTKGAIDGASTAVTISIGLVGIMALWLGMMRVAEEAGLVRALSRLIAPVMRWIFPDVPSDHPAMATMIMSLAANAFGLNNAATPLGIKAMEELQELNPEKDTATNAMVTFLAIITSGVQLIPATAIAVLAAAGSTAPTSIISTTFVATLAATIAGLIAAKVLQRFFPAGGSAVERDTP